MAKPAFIYAFDNLEPTRFTELCGLLLASRYKGFLLGGVGADGGIDGEIDKILGIWQPETVSPLLNQVITPEQKVIFQFKHKVTARVGQAQNRTQLLNLYKCTSNKPCELTRNLIVRENPSTYVLVTNVEVNSVFRSKFIELCKAEHPNIEHYQIIGLDELESWITMEIQLRHLYFPTIFGQPRFNLEMRLSDVIHFIGSGYPGQPLDFDSAKRVDALKVSVLNVGTVTSYINSIVFKTIVDGEIENLVITHFENETMKRLNPDEKRAELQPGRRRDYQYPIHFLQQFKDQGKDVFPVEVLVRDEIENVYRTEISDDMRKKMLE